MVAVARGWARSIAARDEQIEQLRVLSIREAASFQDVIRHLEASIVALRAEVAHGAQTAADGVGEEELNDAAANQEAAAQISELKALNDQLTQELTAKDIVIQSLEHRVETLAVDNARLGEQATHHQKVHSAMAQEIDDLKRMLDAQEGAMQEFGAEREKVNEALALQEAQDAATKEELEALRKALMEREMSSQHHQNEQLRFELERANVGQLMQELQRVSAEALALQEERGRLREDIDTANELVESLKTTNAALERECHAGRSAAGAAAAAADKEIAELRAQLAAERTANSDLDVTVGRLEGELSSEQAAAIALAEANNEFRRQAAEAAAALAKSKADAGDAAAHTQALERLNEELQAALARVESARDAAVADSAVLDALREEQLTTATQLRAAEAGNVDLRRDIEQLKARLSEQSASATSEEIRQLQAELATADRMLHDAAQHEDTLMQDLNALRQQLSDAEAGAAAAKQAEERLREHVDTLTRDCEAAQDEAARLRDGMKEMGEGAQREQRRLADEVASTGKQLHDAEQSLAAERKAQAELQAALHAVSSAAEGSEKLVQLSRDTMAAETSRLRDALAEAEARAQTHAADAANLRRELDAAGQSFSASQEDFNITLRTSMADREAAATELQSVRGTLRHRTAAHDALQSELGAAQAEAAACRERLQRAEEAQNRMQQQKTAAEAAVDAVKAQGEEDRGTATMEAARLRKRINALEEELETLSSRGELQALQRQLREKQAALVEAEKGREDIVQRLTEQTGEAAEWKAKVEGMQRAVDELSKANEQQRVENSRLSADVARLNEGEARSAEHKQVSAEIEAHAVAAAKEALCEARADADAARQAALDAAVARDQLQRAALEHEADRQALIGQLEAEKSATEHLTARLDREAAEFKDLRKQLLDTRFAKEGVERALDEVRATLENLQRHAARDAEWAAAEVARLAGQLEDAQHAREQQAHDVNGLREEIEALRQDAVRERSNITAAAREAERAAEREEDLKRQLTAALAAQDTLAKNFSADAAGNDDLAHTVTASELVVQRIAAEQAAKAVEKWRAEAEGLRTTVEELRTTVTRLESAVDTAEAEAARVKTDLATEQAERQHAVKDMERVLADARARFDEEVALLRVEKGHVDAALTKASAERDDARKALMMERVKHSEAQQACDAGAAEAEDLRAQLSFERGERVQAQQALAQAQDSHAGARAEFDSEAKRLGKELEVRLAEIEALKKLCGVESAERAHVSHVIDAQREDLAALQRSLDDSEAERERLGHSVNALRDDIADVTQRLTKEKTRREQAEIDLDGTRQQVHDLRRDKDELEDEVTAARRALEQERNDADERLHAETRRREQAESDVAHLHDQYQAVKAHNAQLVDDIARAEDEIDQLRRTMALEEDAHIRAMDDRTREAKATAADMGDEIERLRRALQHEQDEGARREEDAGVQLRELRVRNDELSGEVEHLRRTALQDQAEALSRSRVIDELQEDLCLARAASRGYTVPRHKPRLAVVTDLFSRTSERLALRYYTAWKMYTALRCRGPRGPTSEQLTDLYMRTCYRIARNAFEKLRRAALARSLGRRAQAGTRAAAELRYKITCMEAAAPTRRRVSQLVLGDMAMRARRALAGRAFKNLRNFAERALAQRRVQGAEDAVARAAAHAQAMAARADRAEEAEDLARGKLRDAENRIARLAAPPPIQAPTISPSRPVRRAKPAVAVVVDLLRRTHRALRGVAFRRWKDYAFAVSNLRATGGWEAAQHDLDALRAMRHRPAMAVVDDLLRRSQTHLLASAFRRLRCHAAKASAALHACTTADLQDQLVKRAMARRRETSRALRYLFVTCMAGVAGRYYAAWQRWCALARRSRLRGAQASHLAVANRAALVRRCFTKLLGRARTRGVMREAAVARQELVAEKQRAARLAMELDVVRAALVASPERGGAGDSDKHHGDVMRRLEDLQEVNEQLRGEVVELRLQLTGEPVDETQLHLIQAEIAKMREMLAEGDGGAAPAVAGAHDDDATARKTLETMLQRVRDENAWLKTQLEESLRDTRPPLRDTMDAERARRLQGDLADALARAEKAEDALASAVAGGHRSGDDARRLQEQLDDALARAKAADERYSSKDEHHMAVVKALERESDVLRQQVSDAQDRAAVTQGKHATRVAALEEANEVLRRENDDAKGELAASRRRQQQLEREVPALEEEVASLRGELQQPRQDAREREVDVLLRDLRDAQRRRAAAEAEADAAMEEARGLRRQAQDARQEEDDALRQRRALEDEVAQLHREIDALRVNAPRLQLLEDEGARLRREVDTLRTAAAAHDEHVESLLRDLTAARNAPPTTEATALLRTLRNENEYLRAQLKQANDKAVGLLHWTESRMSLLPEPTPILLPPPHKRRRPSLSGQMPQTPVSPTETADARTLEEENAALRVENGNLRAALEEAHTRAMRLLAKTDARGMGGSSPPQSEGGEVEALQATLTRTRSDAKELVALTERPSESPATVPPSPEDSTLQSTGARHLEEVNDLREKLAHARARVAQLEAAAAQPQDPRSPGMGIPQVFSLGSTVASLSPTLSPVGSARRMRSTRSVASHATSVAEREVQLAGELEELRALVKEKVAQMQALKDANRTLQAQADRNLATHAAARDAWDAERARLLDSGDALRQRVTQLERDAVKARDEQEDLAGSNEKMRARLKTQEGLIRENDDAKVRLMDTAASLREAQAALDRAEAALREKTRELEDCEARCMDTKRDTAALQKELRMREQALAGARAEVQSMEGKLAATAETLEVCRRRQGDAEVQLAVTAGVKDQLERAEAEVAALTKALEKAAARGDVERKNHACDLRALEDEIGDLKRDLEESEELVGTLRGERDALREDNTRLPPALAGLAAAEKDAKRLRERLADVEREATSAERELKLLRGARKEQEEAVEAQQAQVDRASDTIRALKAALVEQEDATQQEEATRRKLRRSLDDAVRDLEAERGKTARLATDFAAIRGELDEVCDERDSLRARLDNASGALTQEADGLRQRLQQSEQTKKQLRGNLEEATRECDALRAAQVGHTNALAEMQDRCEALDARLALEQRRASAGRDEEQRRADEAGRVLAAAERRHEQRTGLLEQALAEERGRCADLVTACEGERAKSDELVVQLAASTAKAEALAAEVERAESKQRGLRSDVQALEEAKAAVDAERDAAMREADKAKRLRAMLEESFAELDALKTRIVQYDVLESENQRLQSDVVQLQDQVITLKRQIPDEPGVRRSAYEDALEEGRRLREELREQTEKLDGVRPCLQKMKDAHEVLSRELASHRERLEEAEVERNHAQAQLVYKREENARLESRVMSLESAYDELRQLAAPSAGTGALGGDVSAGTPLESPGSNQVRRQDQQLQRLLNSSPTVHHHNVKRVSRGLASPTRSRPSSTPGSLSPGVTRTGGARRQLASDRFKSPSRHEAPPPSTAATSSPSKSTRRGGRSVSPSLRDGGGYESFSSIDLDNINLGVDVSDTLRVGGPQGVGISYKGVRIVAVKPPAKPTLRPNDVIVGINRTATPGLAQFRQALRHCRPGFPVRVCIRRVVDGEMRDTEVTVTPSGEGRRRVGGTNTVVLRDRLGVVSAGGSPPDVPDAGLVERSPRRHHFTPGHRHESPVRMTRMVHVAADPLAIFSGAPPSRSCERADLRSLSPPARRHAAASPYRALFSTSPARTPSPPGAPLAEDTAAMATTI